MLFTGVYFGVMYVDHVYEPSESISTYLLNNFAHKWGVGQTVRYRKPHRKTCEDKITEVAYSTEKSGGGTIKVYKLNNKWVKESVIKSLIK